MENRGIVRPNQKSIGKCSRFMAEITWFSPRMVLFGVRTMSDIILGKCAPKPPKRGMNRHFKAKTLKLTYKHTTF